MSCGSCASQNQTEFNAEINIHFRGLKNLDKPNVLIFPKILVCLDCGFSAFTTPDTGRAILSAGTRTREALSRQERVGDAARCA